MNRREAQSKIFFHNKQMAQISAAKILTGIAFASFIDRAEIRRKFFISYVY